MKLDYDELTVTLCRRQEWRQDGTATPWRSIAQDVSDTVHSNDASAIARMITDRKGEPLPVCEELFRKCSSISGWSAGKRTHRYLTAILLLIRLGQESEWRNFELYICNQFLLIIKWKNSDVFETRTSAIPVCIDTISLRGFLRSPEWRTGASDSVIKNFASLTITLFNRVVAYTKMRKQ